MNFKKKIYPLLLMAGALTMFGPVTVFAAKSNDKITSVKLTFSDRLVKGGAIDNEEVEFTSSSSLYEVDEWSFENEGLIWEDGDVPRVTVTLLATDDDYSFSVSKDKIKVKGDFAKVYSKKKVDSQTLEITFDLQPMSERMGKVEYAYLDGSVATWAAVPGAVNYELYLYRDSKAVGSRKMTAETTYDFGTATLKAGEYYYRVRAVGADGTKEGVLTDSATFIRQSDGSGTVSQKINNSTAAAGSWQANETGKWWQRADGTWPANQWELINNQWFFFNEGGYMVTGWVNWNGLWYYLGPEGDMWVNRQTPDGFSLNAEGVRIEQ